MGRERPGTTSFAVNKYTAPRDREDRSLQILSTIFAARVFRSDSECFTYRTICILGLSSSVGYE